MPYRLIRERDGAGDGGSMSMTLYSGKDNVIIIGYGRPRVGVAMRVGSLGARSYTPQDWWQTTIITEILLDTPDHMRFKTGSSVYYWYT